MIQEPGALLRDAEVPRHLIGTDAILAISDHPDASKPFVQAERAILEDRSDFRRELPPRMLFFALPYAARANEPNVGAATSWAMHAVRPTQANHEIVRHVGISKMLDRFEKDFGFAFHDANLARFGYCVKYVNALI